MKRGGSLVVDDGPGRRHFRLRRRADFAQNEFLTAWLAAGFERTCARIEPPQSRFDVAAKKKLRTMPKWKPAPPDLVSTFERVARGPAGAEVRKMFGYPAAFIGGHMFTGLHEDRMILRLSEDDRTILLREKGARIFEPLPGRPMREYVVVPEAVLASPSKLSEWLGRALAYARTLPPKSSKGKKSSQKR